MKNKHTYQYGFKTYEKAKEKLWEYMAESEISWAENPDIESYLNLEGKKRYKITLGY